MTSHSNENLHQNGVLRELRFESVSCVVSSSAEQISQDFGANRIGDKSLRRIPCVAGFGELASGNVAYAAVLLLLERQRSSVLIQTLSMPRVDDREDLPVPGHPASRQWDLDTMSCGHKS